MRDSAEDSDDAVTKAIERRRRTIEAEWNELGAVVLIGAGHPIPIPGRSDRVYPFLAHSEYFYLTDHQRPGAVLAYDPQEGWSEFVPAISADERLWSGALHDNAGTPASELGPWLERRRGRRVAQLGAPIPDAPSDPAIAAELRTRMDRVRRRKDDIELARMRVAADATCAGFAAAERFIAPGLSERALQIEIEAGFFRHGADTVAYDSIIASGPNAAVLHHLPTERLLGAGELVLIHAGVEYRDVHLAAALDVAQGLVDAGFLRGNAADLVEQGACALFFPHGIGHMVGLGVRDAGGYLPGRSRSEAPALRFLRIDLPLEPGHVVTIEPGIYFPPHVLEDPEVRRQHRDTVVWNRVDTLRGFGGIRIEDNVLIRDEGNEVLTRAIPKE